MIVSRSLVSGSAAAVLFRRTCRSDVARYATVSGAAATPKRGGFVRGGLLGFLLGTSLAAYTTYTYLLTDYQESSASLLKTVEAMQTTTSKIASQLGRLDKLEEEIKKLKAGQVSKFELETARAEVLKTIDDVNVSHLTLKTEVWELAQAVKSLESK